MNYDIDVVAAQQILDNEFPDGVGWTKNYGVEFEDAISMVRRIDESREDEALMIRALLCTASLRNQETLELTLSMAVITRALCTGSA